jgi:hypothetical protein
MRFQHKETDYPGHDDGGFVPHDLNADSART